MFHKYFWVFLAFVMAGERIAKIYTPAADSEFPTETTYRAFDEYENDPLSEYEPVYSDESVEP
jgi:hypothetical protein